MPHSQAFENSRGFRVYGRTLKTDLGVRLKLISWVQDLWEIAASRWDTCISSWLHLTCGVAQETKLGPSSSWLSLTVPCDLMQPRWKYVDDITIAEQHHLTQPSSLQPVVDKLSS